ncbi:putative transcriptional regulator (ArsR family) with SAM-dependent methyltransferase domain [Azospirillum baldaniorum]|uniref:Transcriptional regulator (ArsR family) with SAM-dependent methyltransferase domain n=2 Tax=Azospirillum baldaniorum TaxID=1064539 RepID=A0A9P1JRI4_9PROT|nr:putative transcriptional regulator (ArsR family) with SAM-dependent methyltransferase domain [Azospirillum baldaniorum]
MVPAVMDELLATLKAAAETTRLRLLALCAHGELTVTELTQILGQSQPRVSRHLKLLCDAGLLDRFREGTFAFYRLTERGASAELARVLVDAIPSDDPTMTLDLERLEAIKRARSEAAASYFRENAARWHEIRSLHVPEREVEEALLRLIPADGIGDLLDIGTGTGRMLEVLGPRARRAVGVDQSREMLSIARTKLEDTALRHCHVRQADMYQLPFPSGSFDAAIVHQVLHFAEAPADLLAEAARVLRPGGLLLLVDFAPHALESLRAEHAHRRLGFADAEVAAWCRQCGLDCGAVVHLPGEPLTVSIWPAVRAAKGASPADPSILSISGAQS